MKEKERKKNRKGYSIKTLMIMILLVCWLIPFLLITGATAQYIISHHFDNKISNLLVQLDFYNELSAERLRMAVAEAKKASYDGNINEMYLKNRNNEISRSQLIREGNAYLSKHYNGLNAMQFVIISFQNVSDPYYCNAVNESAGGKFQMIQKYWKYDAKIIEKRAEHLGTGIGFYTSGGRVYLFRNLLNSKYERIATQVVRLNEEYCFGHINTMAEDVAVSVQVNDMLLKFQEEGHDPIDLSVVSEHPGENYFWDKNKLYIGGTVTDDLFKITSNVKFEDSSIYYPIYGYRVILFGMALLLIPLFLTVIQIFRKRVQDPVEAMMYGALQIENGRFGFQLSEEMGTKELLYLQNAFNQMSLRLKDQFDHIYEEEIALRDARIMALQSHINPHFMNNTLEIINWEARMSGAEKVSEMITALGTLMDATIDRKKQPEVLLSEEMKYVNAYFYITSERLGDRLKIYNEIPESVMDCYVPRLILQPVIENAIEHGVVRMGSGSVTLRGHVSGKYLYLDIINDADINDFDGEKIGRLLDMDYDTSKEPSGNLGIANVNQRLRILYGEPCGLSIRQMDEQHIIATLTIFIHKQARKDKK